MSSVITVKTILTSIVVVLLGAACAQAAPVLFIKAVISEHHSNGETEVIKPKGITVTSGKETVIKAGILEYAVTPTLLDNGRVVIEGVLIRHGESKVDKYVAPTVKVDLDDKAHVSIGRFEISTTTSLAR